MTHLNSTLGFTLATYAHGHVADNAGDIAVMTGFDEVVRQRTHALDALGNSTAATGKRFVIGSAVLTAVALVASFIYTWQIEDACIDILDAAVIPGLTLTLSVRVRLCVCAGEFS